MYNVKPGDKAVIINSVNGLKGLSVGRKVLVHANVPVENSEFDNAYCDQFNALNDPNHYCPPSPYERPHSELGKIWPVTCLEGKPFADNNGSLRKYIDVPDQFLRKILDTTTKLEKRKTIEVS